MIRVQRQPMPRANPADDGSSAAANEYNRLPPIVGFRRSTAETWYPSKNDCEEALKKPGPAR